MIKKTISILGATGSIGSSTLDVIRQNQDFDVFAVTGNKNIKKLAEICLEFNPKFAVTTSIELANKLENLISNKVDTKIIFGKKALVDVAIHQKVDLVMSAVVGVAGLESTFAAATAGKTILLANKESLVVAGHLLMEEVSKNNATLLPVDSEHNAIFQCLEKSKKFAKGVDEILLTASGGPFKAKLLSELTDITPEQACAHPNWSMGKKISVDSSTMVNKALEVIEAYWLFDIPIDKLKVLIHPQSIIHSMVRYTDGSYIAQMGVADMKTPIANAMYYPKRGDINIDKLDFVNTTLTFQKPCFDRFKALRIVFNNLKNKKYYANIIFNAANEILVEAFLNNKIKYLDILNFNIKTIQQLKFDNPTTLAEIYQIDKQTREFVYKNFLEEK